MYGGDRATAPPAGDPAGSRARVAAAAALGALGAAGPGVKGPVAAALGALLQASYATSRQLAGMVMAAWVDAAAARGQAGEAAEALRPLLELAVQILQGAQVGRGRAANHPANLLLIVLCVGACVWLDLRTFPVFLSGWDGG